MDTLNHVVSFSSGLSSALTVERVINKYPDKNVSIVFMDTTIEDDDNYRFMRDCQKRWLSLYNQNIVTLSDGRTPYQVFDDQHVIPNSRVAPCTHTLKIKQFQNYMKDKFGKGNSDNYKDVTVHIGYDYSEIHRCDATKSNYNKYGWHVDFPLLWKPIEYRPYEDVVRLEWGIQPPRMYSMGYSHANCGGRCVKQGQNDWLRTLKNFPERYAESEEWERNAKTDGIRDNYTLLKRSRNGKVEYITLETLRKERGNEVKEQGDMFINSDTENEICVVCGVGDMMADVDQG